MTADVRMEIKVRNNLILKKMEAAGFKSVGALIKGMNASGIKIRGSSLYKLIAMRTLPEGRHGTWYPDVEKLAEFFKCNPEDLFSSKQRSTKLDGNRAVAEMEYATFERIAVATPEQVLLSNEMQSVIAKAILTLPPKQERVLRLRFGIGVEQQTLDEIAVTLGVGRARVGQIERVALRRLKHPDRIKPLKNLMEDL